jgi:citrate synthase
MTCLEGLSNIIQEFLAIARVAGWLAHWKEQLAENRVFRPTQIYTGSHVGPNDT